jgi:hypothetical protein
MEVQRVVRVPFFSYHFYAQRHDHHCNSLLTPALTVTKRMEENQEKTTTWQLLLPQTLSSHSHCWKNP